MINKESALAFIHLFQCQSAFLQRVDMFGFAPDCEHVLHSCEHGGPCVADNVHKLYTDAMEEAIRCIKIVHGFDTQDTVH